MPSGPRRPAFLRVRPLAPAAPEPTAAGDRHGLVVSARTPVEAAHGALRDTLRDLHDQCDGALPAASDPAVMEAEVLEPDRWADDGGPLGRRYAGDHRLSAAERGVWEGHACDRVHAAVGAYARALRRDGVGLLAALAAVRATFVQDGTLLPSAVLAAVHRDAMRCCLEAFYAH